MLAWPQIIKSAKFFNSLCPIIFWESFILYIFIYCKLFTPENIDSDLLTFSILKFEISRIFKESQSENKLVISVTNEVLKEDKSIDSNWLHPKNIEAIFSTEEVTKFDK